MQIGEGGVKNTGAARLPGVRVPAPSCRGVRRRRWEVAVSIHCGCRLSNESNIVVDLNFRRRKSLD